MICAPASIYAWWTRNTASGSVAFSSSKQRCVPTNSCNSDPMAPSAMRMESFSRSLNSSIFTFCYLVIGSLRRSVWRSALLFHQPGDGAHQVVLGEDFEACAIQFDENRGIFVAKNVRDALHRRAAGNPRDGLAHHFANHQFAQILALQGEIEDLVLIHGAHGNVFLKNGNLRNVLFLHGLQRVEHRLIRTRNKI